MKFKSRKPLLAFLVLFTCAGSGHLCAMHRKTAGEHLDESVDKVEETAKRAKWKAKDTAETAKEKAENAEKNAKEKAAEIAENAKEKADNAHKEAKRKAHKGIDKL